MIRLESPGWQQWRATELKGYAAKLAPKMNAQKIAVEQLGQFNNHSMLVSHREGDGQVEVHERQADVFVVQSGEGEIIIGGEVVDGKPTAPGEIRGATIKGGERTKLGAGDIVRISAGVPHQFLVARGRKLTCMFVKIEESK